MSVVVSSDFTPVFRFVTMSDVHTHGEGDFRLCRMQTALNSAYEYAESSSYKKIDVVFFDGDQVDSGTVGQYEAFLNAANASVREGSVPFAVLAKYHDCGGEMGRGARDYYEEKTGQCPDFHKVVGGFHFIGVSACPDNTIHYSDEQVALVDKWINEAVTEDASKPVFFFHHEHIMNTVYGSKPNEWAVPFFRDVCCKYPQVVHFSGHSHYPLNDPRSIWQNEFTAIGMGAISYMEFTVDGEKKIHPEGYETTGQYYIVEADKDNNIRLIGCDTVSGKVLCEHILTDIADKNNRPYSTENQISASSAPVFTQMSANVEKSVDGIAVTVAKADSTDGKIVFLYRAVGYDENGGEVASAYTVNNYWTQPVYDKVKINLPEGDYSCIKVFAENAFGMKSEPVVVTL